MSKFWLVQDCKFGWHVGLDLDSFVLEKDQQTFLPSHPIRQSEETRGRSTDFFSFNDDNVVPVQDENLAQIWENIVSRLLLSNRSCSNLHICSW